MTTEKWTPHPETGAHTALGLYAYHIGDWFVASGPHAKVKHSMIEEPTVLEARALLRMQPGSKYTRVAVHAFIRETGTVEDCDALARTLQPETSAGEAGRCPGCWKTDAESGEERVELTDRDGFGRWWHSVCLERVQQRQWLTCCECGDRIARREECSPKGDVTCGPCFHDKRGSTHYDRPTNEKAPDWLTLARAKAPHWAAVERTRDRGGSGDAVRVTTAPHCVTGRSDTWRMSCGTPCGHLCWETFFEAVKQHWLATGVDADVFEKAPERPLQVGDRVRGKLKKHQPNYGKTGTVVSCASRIDGCVVVDLDDGASGIDWHHSKLERLVEPDRACVPECTVCGTDNVRDATDDHGGYYTVCGDCCTCTSRDPSPCPRCGGCDEDEHGEVHHPGERDDRTGPTNGLGFPTMPVAATAVVTPPKAPPATVRLTPEEYEEERREQDFDAFLRERANRPPPKAAIRVGDLVERDRNGVRGIVTGVTDYLAYVRFDRLRCSGPESLCGLTVVTPREDL